jgi:outer membrane protein assembly factor BamB
LGLKDNRYYNGVSARWTTTCCSAVALGAWIALATTAHAAKKSDQGPLPFWPVQPIWTLALNNELTDAPAFDEAHAYFPIEENRLVAYELTTGKQLWLVEARPQRAPVAGGDFVFIVEDDAIVAMKASDGTRVWRTAIDGTLAAPPVWSAGWLLVAVRGGAIVALRADDGRRIWRREVGVTVHAPPAISGTRVYLPLEDWRIVALRIEDGEPVWERKLGGTPDPILALDDRLFVSAADGYCYSIETDKGQVDWRKRIGAAAVGLPAVDEHRVYIVSLDNVVRALNRSNGVQQWIQLLKLRPIGGPLRAGATLIVYGPSPPLRAFNVSDGKGGGDVPAAGGLAVAPQVVGADEPRTFLVLVTRDVAKGDSVTLLTRSVEPPASPLTPLPNPVTAVPVLPPQP